MKQALLLSIAAICFFVSGFLIAKNKYDIYPQYPIITRIAMPNYYREITGCDSIELIRNYDEKSVHANFCYPNQWEREKFRKDTVFIRDTVYASKYYNHVGTVNIGHR